MRTWFITVGHALTSRMRSERGAQMVEYALLVALMAIGVLAAMEFFAGERVSVWEKVGSSLP